MVMRPKIEAFEYTVTWSSMIGCLGTFSILPFSSYLKLLAPSVTP